MMDDITYQEYLDAMHWQVSVCDPSPLISPAQLHGLNGSLLSKVFGESHDARVWVLRELTGLKHLQSSKQLTIAVAAYLITQLIEPGSKPWELSDHGQALLEKAKERYEKSIY